VLHQAKRARSGLSAQDVALALYAGVRGNIRWRRERKLSI
jgi:hypothetical protein